LRNRLWTSDFVIEDGVIRVKKTGHRLVPDLKLWHSILTWLCFYALAQGWRLRRRVAGHRRPTIAFTPDVPRPWYLIWPVAQAAGARLVDRTEDADIVMAFDDSTMSEPGTVKLRAGARAVNLDCRDISKTSVAQVFETVAGYGLVVDPSVHAGPLVDKSEVNGAHDGRVVEGPVAPRPGRAYQRLIDNEIAGGLVEDLRTVTVGNEPVVVFRKRRPLARRFANDNVAVEFCRPADVFSPAEIELISRFTRELRLDWGGVDVLRDRADGRIYIVDANKTDMGPPIALKLKYQLRATRILARAFARAFAP
jgi:hypothetical protein